MPIFFKTVALLPMLLLLISGSLPVFAKDCAKASGKLVQASRSFKGFSALEAQNAVSVNITRSDSFSVIIEADSCVLNDVSISQDGAMLRISQHSSLPNNPGASISIKMPDLRFVKADGACRITIDSFSIKDNAVIDLDGASSFQGIFVCPRMQASVSGASSMLVSGKCAKLHAEADGASSIQLGGLVTRMADVSINGASSGCVNVSDSLAVDVSGASQLRYSGKPVITSQKVNGASSFDKAKCD
jgi:hypothetical protein